jgi:carbon monoxide dehydrogenase subunit G
VARFPVGREGSFDWSVGTRSCSPSSTISGVRSGSTSAAVGCTCRVASAARIVTTVAAPIIDYRRGFQFALTPEDLWERIEDVDQFEHWWPWLSECELEGNGLARGSVLRGVVAPPLPYRMRVRVELGQCERPRSIEAKVGGDLTGVALLTMHPELGGTCAEVAWTIEMRQPVMRLASRFGYPLLRWGHDRVVEATVDGFRRQIES